MGRPVLRLLLLTHYFEPDLSACSFRAAALYRALCAQAPPGAIIDVLTTRPNRYRSFVAEAPAVEIRERGRVDRITLPSHRSGILDQSRAFLTFARQASMAVQGRHYDVVFATSSRLMTAVLGARLAERTGARLYLDLRDIFADSVKEVLPPAVAIVAAPVASHLERWAVHRADRVNLVSAGFAEYFTTRYPGRQFSYVTNGIDEEFLDAATPTSPRPVDDRRLAIVYAGNVGQGQGLDLIVPGLAHRLGDRAHFRIIGDGGRREALATALAARGVANVDIVAPVTRGALLEEYRRADVLFLHLNDYEAYKKVLPSKIFEYAATGKPVWAGVAGYAAHFLRTEVTNAAVFSPGNVNDAMRTLEELSMGETPRRAFVETYARSRVSTALASDILALADVRPAGSGIDVGSVRP
jgi:glycosyltransferase involved in cell wall biosynthesis